MLKTVTFLELVEGGVHSNIVEIWPWWLKKNQENLVINSFLLFEGKQPTLSLT